MEYTSESAKSRDNLLGKEGINISINRIKSSP